MRFFVTLHIFVLSIIGTLAFTEHENFANVRITSYKTISCDTYEKTRLTLKYLERIADDFCKLHSIKRIRGLPTSVEFHPYPLGISERGYNIIGTCNMETGRIRIAGTEPTNTLFHEYAHWIFGLHHDKGLNDNIIDEFERYGWRRIQKVWRRHGLSCE